MVSSINSTSSYDRTSMTTQIAQKLFKKLDSNNDGGIDATEFAAISGNGSSTDISQVFSKIDTNGDGKIDANENENALQKLSAKMQSHFSKMRGSGAHKPPSPDEMFSKLDTNGDGGIDESEFAQMSKYGNGQGPKFSDFDTNGDGKIDKTENADAMRKMGPPPGGHSGSSKAGKSDFSDILSALKSTLDEDTGDDDTSSSIKDLFNQLQNNIKYGSQGNVSLNTSGTDSLFSLTA